ncbi:uncharacterized protein BP5553_04704 [Venustampulla echinocandica]|uniref:Copper-fist domain-containing protein n=1 Tax=Venustampulla echinocandica TaxID=2656787 RepID=A0A370TP29_9HELO|nr:uncharacterized protein BP5553_04704 [Venustampulla echinocandica]RDL37271.1 hypothetical protein BP5553_04704 [Venustampulla echinocandica]
MPIINGYKYSCEPCIRGHRATSCTHTDRILIEVRKPGRPLESCGHEFDTCTCGRLRDIGFFIDDVPTHPSFIPETQARSMTSPTTATAKTTQAKARSREKPKRSKRPSRKTSAVSQGEGSRKMEEGSTTQPIDQTPTIPQEQRSSSVYSPLNSPPSSMWFGSTNSTGQGMVPGMVEDITMGSNPSLQQPEAQSEDQTYTRLQYMMPGQEQTWRPMR